MVHSRMTRGYGLVLRRSRLRHLQKLQQWFSFGRHGALLCSRAMPIASSHMVANGVKKAAKNGKIAQHKRLRHAKQAGCGIGDQSLRQILDKQRVDLSKLREQNEALNAELRLMKAASHAEKHEGKGLVGSTGKRKSSSKDAAHTSKEHSAGINSCCHTKAELAEDNVAQKAKALKTRDRASSDKTAMDTLHHATLVSSDIEQRRTKLQIRVEQDPDGVCPAPLHSFEELTSLPQYVFDNLKRQGIQSPMPIQAQALPLILGKHDVIGLAQTGSGKTLAFLLPIAVQLASLKTTSFPKPSILILAPTRELAVQISQESDKIFQNSESCALPSGVTTVCVYGGGDKWPQQTKLKWGAHVVVATPGRLLDFVTAGVACLSKVTYFVLDEADRMLDMGFHEDVVMIASRLRPKRQVLFFSATWSAVVQQLAANLCTAGTKPVRISYGQGSSGNDASTCDDANRKARTGIIQDVVVIDDAHGEDRWERQERLKNEKLYAHLTSVLAASEEHKVLVFVSRKDLADKVSAQLQGKGFKADAMHGGKTQSYRLWVLEQFRQGKLRLLICTDVLGRGIDIPSVSHVVIHEMGEIQDYIHRIGRTARGRYGKGHALVFFEYWEGYPHIAGDLIDVLSASKQSVPRELQQIADEVAAGKRQTRNINSQSRT